MRYVFRLQTVLRVRRAEEKAARAKLHQANVSLVSAIAARDLAEARYLATSAHVADVASLLGERCDADLAARSVERAQRQVGRAASEAALAHVAWRSAAQRVTMLERLDERRHGEYLQEEARREVAMVDDIVGARHAMAVNP